MLGNPCALFTMLLSCPAYIECVETRAPISLLFTRCLQVRYLVENPRFPKLCT